MLPSSCCRDLRKQASMRLHKYRDQRHRPWPCPARDNHADQGQGCVRLQPRRLHAPPGACIVRQGTPRRQSSPRRGLVQQPLSQQAVHTSSVRGFPHSSHSMTVRGRVGSASWQGRGKEGQGNAAQTNREDMTGGLEGWRTNPTHPIPTQPSPSGPKSNLHTRTVTSSTAAQLPFSTGRANAAPSS